MNKIIHCTKLNMITWIKSRREKSCFLQEIHKQIEDPQYSDNKNSKYVDFQADIKNDDGRHLYCKATYLGVYVAYDGKMYPCDSFSAPYYSEPLNEGFKNAVKKIKEIAKDIVVPEQCFNCKNIRKCGPCAARLISEREAADREGVPCGYEPV